MDSQYYCSSQLICSISVVRSPVSQPACRWFDSRFCHITNSGSWHKAKNQCKCTQYKNQASLAAIGSPKPQIPNTKTSAKRASSASLVITNRVAGLVSLSKRKIVLRRPLVIPLPHVDWPTALASAAGEVDLVDCRC